MGRRGDRYSHRTEMGFGKCAESDISSGTTGSKDPLLQEKIRKMKKSRPLLSRMALLIRRPEV